MKKILLSVILIAVITNLCSAQVAGFRGKHFMLGYSVNTSLAPASIGEISLYEASHSINNYGDLFFFKHSLNADYIVARQVVAGVEADYMRHLHIITEEEFTLPNNTSEYIVTRNYLTAYSIGASVKYYNRTNHLIAPVGSYLKNKLFIMAIDEEKISKHGTIKTETFYTPGFECTYGQSRVIKDVIVLDGGLNVTLPFRVFDFESFGTGERSPLDNAGYKYITNYCISVKLGVSGLLF